MSIFIKFACLILGAPHIHSLVWLEDDDGNPVPRFKEMEEDSNDGEVTFTVEKGKMVNILRGTIMKQT